VIAAIFDLDGTLYTGHIPKGIARYHRIHRVKRLPLTFYVIAHAPLWPLWRSGLISEMTIRELCTRHLGWMVRGWTPQEAAVAFAWVAEKYVLPRVRPDVLARLREHQTAGHQVIIVSGTLAPLLTEIGRRLGVEETVGTPLVLRAGRYTGGSERPVCQGRGKVSRLKAYLSGEDRVSWGQSYAYADSYVDLPLLQHVGNPVAVYPDEQLRTFARRRGWEIIEPSV